MDRQIAGEVVAADSDTAVVERVVCVDPVIADDGAGQLRAVTLDQRPVALDEPSMMDVIQFTKRRPDGWQNDPFG